MISCSRHDCTPPFLFPVRCHNDGFSLFSADWHAVQFRQAIKQKAGSVNMLGRADEMMARALQFSPPLPSQRYTVYHHLTLSLVNHTHTLTMFTSQSLDMPYIGMSGISHLIRSYIYIEHKALWHAIEKTGGREHECAYNRVILRNICCTCACWNVWQVFFYGFACSDMYIYTNTLPHKHSDISLRWTETGVSLFLTYLWYSEKHASLVCAG